MTGEIKQRMETEVVEKELSYLMELTLRLENELNSVILREN